MTDASRPRFCPSASTTYQRRSTVPGLALRVVTGRLVTSTNMTTRRRGAPRERPRSLGKCGHCRNLGVRPPGLRKSEMATNGTPDNRWSGPARDPVAGAPMETRSVSRCVAIAAHGKRCQQSPFRGQPLLLASHPEPQDLGPEPAAGRGRAGIASTRSGRARRAEERRRASSGGRRADRSGGVGGPGGRALRRLSEVLGPERVEELLDFLEGPAEGAYLHRARARAACSPSAASPSAGAPAPDRLRPDGSPWALLERGVRRPADAGRDGGGAPRSLRRPRAAARADEDGPLPSARARRSRSRWSWPSWPRRSSCSRATACSRWGPAAATRRRCSARLAARVHAVEVRDGAGAACRREPGGGRGRQRPRCTQGDGTAGWPPGAPYDAISVAAGARAVPPALLEQLAAGGRLVMPLGRRPGASAWCGCAGTRRARTGSRTCGIPVRFVPLVCPIAAPASRTAAPGRAWPRGGAGRACTGGRQVGARGRRQAALLAPALARLHGSRRVSS